MSEVTNPNFLLCVDMCLKDVDMALAHAEQMDAYADDTQKAFAVQIGTRLSAVRRLLILMYEEIVKAQGGDAYVGDMCSQGKHLLNKLGLRTPHANKG